MKTKRKSGTKSTSKTASRAAAKKSPKKGSRKRGPKSKKDLEMIANSPFKVVNGYNLDDMPGKGKFKNDLPLLIKSMETMEVSRVKGIPLTKERFNEKQAIGLYSAAVKRFKGSKHVFTSRVLKDSSERFIERVIFRIG
jgi:hypothetical protein